MYTIIMNSDKTLSATQITKIYQRENLVDQIQFLFPQFYNNHDLSKFTAVLKYIDQGNTPHSEILQQDTDLYKGKVRFFLPVDTNITKFAGTITLRITLSMTDLSIENQYILHTGSYKLVIDKRDDYFSFMPDEVLEPIDQKIGQLEAQIQYINAIAETYNQTKADDLSYQDNVLQLLSNGEKIGQPVTLISEGEVENIAKEYIDSALTIVEL